MKNIYAGKCYKCGRPVEAGEGTLERSPWDYKKLRLKCANHDRPQSHDTVFFRHHTPTEIYKEIERERPPCERQAMFADHDCMGTSTMEHVWLWKGRQIDEKWAIIRLCEFAHSVNAYQDGGILDKSVNEYISLTHATEEDLKKYPNRDWSARRELLRKKFE